MKFNHVSGNSEAKPAMLRDRVQVYRQHLLREASDLRGLLLVLDGATQAGLPDSTTIGMVRSILEATDKLDKEDAKRAEDIIHGHTRDDNF